MISGHTGCNGEKILKSVNGNKRYCKIKVEHYSVWNTCHGGNTNLQKVCSSSPPNVPVVKLLYSCRTSVFHIVSHRGWLAEHLAVDHSDNNIFTIINGWLAEHLAVNHSDNNIFTINVKQEGYLPQTDRVSAFVIQTDNLFHGWRRGRACKNLVWSACKIKLLPVIPCGPTLEVPQIRDAVIHDRITCARFDEDWLQSLGVACGQILSLLPYWLV